MDKNVVIDTSQIPDCHRFSLLGAVFADNERFYSQPGVEERFQEWLKEKQEALAS